MGAAKVRKLVAQIERGDGRDLLPDYAKRVTRTEEGFLLAAFKKAGAKVYRDGWPDFLMEHEGKTFGVEVKNGVCDRLRDTQVTIFPILEKLGIPIYVWIPSKPNVLTPWRKHGSPTPRSSP